jgi:DNA-binding NtrC family response regulator
MTKLRLIVIDDDASFGNFVSQVAMGLDIDVDVVTSVKQFEKLYSSHRYDIVTTDISMPDKDGIELIEELAELDCQAAIIIISGKEQVILNGATKIAEQKGLNIVATLQKPFDVDEFEALMISEIKKIS